MNKPLRQTSTALRILPEETPLQGKGPLVSPHPWPMTPESEVPRALRALSKIIDGGLCHRCGSCVGICPTGVLSLTDEEYPTVSHLSACTDCDLCVRVCPGDEFQYKEMHEKVLGVPGEEENTHGHFLEAAIAHAADPVIQERSTSGGLVTALVLDLLAKKEIDGVLCITSSETELWKGKPIIARTEAEILGAMKSKYAISPTNALLAEIRSTPGRYVVVGLPCQIHGITKARELDERVRERVVLTIGLFCHAAIEHEAFRVIWSTLGERTNGARRFISRIGKHPGTPYIEQSDGTMYPVYFGQKTGYRPTSIEMINILYRLYTPPRCLTCFDALSEFADIAVGDPWMAPPEDDVNFYDGWSFTLIRTERGRKAYTSLVEGGKLVSKTVTRREALACNRLMAGEKRWRAFRVIETHRRQGKPIPTYGMGIPEHGVKHFLKTELHMLTHLFCFLPKYRAKVLRFVLGEGGYQLLWLNEKRRAFRFWRRDTLASLRRRLVGRT